MSVKLFLKTILFSCLLAITACQSCSKSGRTQLAIKQALVEAARSRTEPQPNTIKEDNLPITEDLSDIASETERRNIKRDLKLSDIPPAIGELIQVEGLVFKELNEITINANTGPSQIEQILTVKQYVQRNWHYVFDPALDRDTWRSAEATIALKYNGKYSGDCDDFAILLASFARQIGLNSLVVGGFNSQGEGHAFAVFQLNAAQIEEIQKYNVDYHSDPKGGAYWVSLDWFSGSDHAQFENLTVLVE